MIPQSFPVLPTLLIHSDKELLSLMRVTFQQASQVKMMESLNSVHPTYERITPANEKSGY